MLLYHSTIRTVRTINAKNLFLFYLHFFSLLLNISLSPHLVLSSLLSQPRQSHHVDHHATLISPCFVVEPSTTSCHPPHHSNDLTPSNLSQLARTLSFSSGGFFVVVVGGFFFSGCGLIFLACSGGLYKYIYIYICTGGGSISRLQM